MFRIFAIVAIGLACLLSLWFSTSGQFEGKAASIFSLGRPRQIDQNQFQSQALRQVNQLRIQLSQPLLLPADELQESLGRFIENQPGPSDISLDTLFNSLQEEYPGAQFLSATLLHDSRQSGLLDSLSRWEDTTNTDYETFSTHVFPNGFRTGCIAVLARQLPSFDLEAANRDGGRFFNLCPICDRTHAVELETRSRTLILTCPDCSNAYDVLAADTEGRFRRATDFFETFSLPLSTAREIDTPFERMRQVWVGVLGHCEYEYDSKKNDRGEAWKTSSQTWGDQAGDCEDTAILLADSLLSAGIEARVAIGWNSHIGQHAWCVARIGGDQYVLESTLKLRKNSTPEPLPVAESSREYQPEQLFDRTRLYFRESDTPLPCNDYWSADAWRTVTM